MSGAGRKCKYCDAEIFWAASQKSGKMIPLEIAPVKVWIRCQEDGARVDSSEPRVVQRRGFVNHFETCPGADQARKDAATKRKPPPPDPNKRYEKDVIPVEREGGE